MKWFEWNEPMGAPGNPFLFRWKIDFYYFSFRLHKWICSDDSRAYHSHPVNFASLILWGSYIDHELLLNKGETGTATRRLGPGKINIIRKETKHWVEILEKPTWTLMFTWGKPVRWDFWDRWTLKRRKRDRYFLEEGNHICD